MSFIIVLALEIHCVCSILKRCGDYVKTLFPRWFRVEYTWSFYKALLKITSALMPFENFDPSFTQYTILLLLLTAYSLADNIYSLFLTFFYTLISFHFLLIMDVSVAFCKIFDLYAL